MQEADSLSIFPERLNRANVPYMVTGSVASMVYGEPRITHDIDMVIAIKPDQVETLVAAFPQGQFYCPPVEVIKVELTRDIRGHFNIIDRESGLKADIYPIGKDPLHLWAFDRREKVQYGTIMLSVAPPEYVIVRKLQYYQEGGSEKHIRDIKKMLEVSQERIDRKVLEEKLRQTGLAELWQKLDRDN